MRGICEYGNRRNITFVGNDKVVLLYADIAGEDLPRLKKWQEDKLIPCVLQVCEGAKVIICDKDKFYLNEEEYHLKESEREELLKKVLSCTLETPFSLNRKRADGTPEYRPFKWYSWNELAIRYANICKLVREYFGERFYIVGGEKQ